jgi:hypothetical protein
MPSDCDSKYTVWEELTLECERHLRGSREGVRHSATYLGVVWFWTNEEADD